MSIKLSFNTKSISSLKAGNVSLGREEFVLKGSQAATVILIHGLTGTPNEMSFLAGFFHRKGYSIICPRLANHGKPIGILQKTTWQECYQSVRDSFMKVADSGDQIFVSGLSMGALLALLLALEFPLRISALSCLSPTLFYDGWNMPWSRHLLPLAYYTPLKHFIYFKEDPPYGIKNEAIRSHVHNYYRQAKLQDYESVDKYGYPYFPVALLYQLHLLKNYLCKRLKSIEVAVQVVQAKDDDMTSIKNSQFIYDNVSSKVKELVLLQNSYHVITADQERDTVAKKMEEFFCRVSLPEAVRT